MATFTWLGGSAKWSASLFWTINGTPAGAPPVLSTDDAVLAGASAYTVTVDGQNNGPNSLTILNPAATLSFGSFTYLAVGTGGLVNDGTLQVSNGAHLEVGYSILGFPGGSITNNGLISLSGGAQYTLWVATTTSNAFRNVQNVGGTMIVRGNLDNTGATLRASQVGSVILSNVSGGTIVNDGTTTSASISSGYFTDVTWQGPIELSSPNGGITFAGASHILPLPGSPQAIINVHSGGNLNLGMDGTLDNTQINVSDTVIGGVVPQLIIGTPLGATSALNVSWVANANISANYGAITNSGIVTLLLGSNAGSIASTGVGNNLFVPYIQAQLGAMENTGVFSESGGFMRIGEQLTGAGTIAVAGNGTVELQQGYGQQQFRFDDGTGLLRLDLPAGAAQSTVTGFSRASTIELVNAPAPNLVFQNHTLTATNGPVFLANLVMPDVPANTLFQVSIDANSNSFISELACFAAGTTIATPHGDIPVEHLRPGDRVRSAFGGHVPIQWVGRRTLRAAGLRNPAAIYPIRIAPSALAPGVPTRDLFLSPDHALYLDGVLVPAALLVNGTTITRAPVTEITYFHLELPQHDVILAEGAACESYLDTGNRADFDNAPPAPRPDEDANTIWLSHACAPQCRNGARLDAIRTTLSVVSSMLQTRALRAS